MSSILKALRKVEDENAAMGDGSVDLAHDILKRNYADPQRKRWPLVVLLACFVVVAFGSILWLLTTGSQPQTPVQLEQPAVETIATENKPADIVAPLAEEKGDPLMALPEQLINAPDNEVAVVVPAPAVEIPPLRVDEIVYHQDPDARLAVINDLPVMEGTEIDGVHIEEILPDAIRCFYQGVQFKIFKAR